jgi:hypothetical protein
MDGLEGAGAIPTDLEDLSALEADLNSGMLRR